jgi:hypothetical protein
MLGSGIQAHFELKIEAEKILNESPEFQVGKRGEE